MGAICDIFKTEEEEYEPDPFSVHEHKLRQEIHELVSTISKNVPSTEPYRILVCSGPNDGKSSLIINIMSALNGMYTRSGSTGQDPDHVTHKYLECKMTIEGQPTQFLLCDTRGLDVFGDAETFYNNMCDAVMGRLSSGQNMSNTSAYASGNESTRRASNSTGNEGSIRKSAVAIFFVTSADKLKSEASEGLQNSLHFKAMSRTIRFANKHGIPTAFFISKCDLLDDAVNKNVKVLYNSKKVKQTKYSLHSSFNGFPLNRIFPIVNYTKQMIATPGMMIPTLYAMKHVMTDIHVYLTTSTYRV